MSMLKGSTAFKQETKIRLREVIGSIALLSQPLSLADLSELLGDEFPKERVYSLLKHVNSFITLPSSQDDATPIRAFHASFEDHVTDEKRADSDFYYVERGPHHAMLAKRCLDVMKKYLDRDNICDLAPNQDYDEVDGLADIRNKRIPPVLEYACRYWSYHLDKATSSGNVLCNALELTDALHTFTSTLLLRWIDVLAVTRNLDKCVTMLTAARKSLSVCF